MDADAVVIGAGVSGLACASALAAAGRKVVVLEARSGIGGRISTYYPEDGGPSLELGAQVVHGNANPVAAVLGDRALVRDQRAAAARVVIGDKVAELRTLAPESAPGEAPWMIEAAMARQVPADISIENYLTSLDVSAPSRRVAAEWFRQQWAAEPRELSARGVATARRADAVGTGEHAVDGGFARLPRALARGLTVRLDCPVRLLAWSPGRVQVHAADGTVTARAAVVTAPPGVVASGGLRIEAMPVVKAAAARQLRLGDACCAVLTMTRPAPESAVVFDASGRSGFVRCVAGRPEVLIVGKAGAAAVVRHGDLCALVGRALPWAARIAVRAARVADWGGDPWITGGFSFPRAGGLWAAAAWGEPVARTVFFAGEAVLTGRRLPRVHGSMGTGFAAARQVMEVMG